MTLKLEEMMQNNVIKTEHFQLKKKHNTETMIIKALTFNVPNTWRTLFSNRKDAFDLISMKKAQYWLLCPNFVGSALH